MELPRTDDSDRLNDLVHKHLEEQLEKERHLSYGIGGAGNMRRRSEMEAAEEILKNSPPDERRMSTWSAKSTSNLRRRESIVETMTGIFRKNSKKDATVEESN